ncbi:MAG: FRG domain-containing protein [Parvularculaceae bacterium]
MTTATIRNLSEYINVVEQNCGQDICLFRGQTQPWPLLPKIARLNPRNDVTRDERSMIDDFRRHVGDFVVRSPENDWDLLSLAQHHGMATRLLDWTTNALAALWFAVEKPAESKSPGTVYYVPLDDDDMVSDRTKSPFEAKKTLFFAPNVVTTRIRSQGAFFSAHRISSRGEWIPLEKNRQFRDRIDRVHVPAEAFSDIRSSLSQCGVNRATLFPDLDGLCSFLTWNNFLFSDEGEPARQPRRRNPAGPSDDTRIKEVAKKR